MNITNIYTHPRERCVAHLAFVCSNGLMNSRLRFILIILIITGWTSIPSAQNTGLYATSPVVEPGEEFKIEVKTTNFNNVVGMQMTLKWNADVLEFLGTQEMEDFALPMLDAADFNPEPPNKLRVVWFDFNLTGIDLSDDATVFSLKFKAIGNHGDTSSLAFLNDPVAIEISTQNGVLTLDITDGLITLDNPNNVRNPFSKGTLTVESPYPNPFLEFTEIPLTIKETTTVTFRIYDVSGKEIHHANKTLNQGNQRVKFEHSTFPKPGVYYLTIETGGELITKELIFTEKK